MTEPAIEWLNETWGSLAALCQQLSLGQWALPTDCPGWSVQDQLAHIVGTEKYLSGEQLPSDPVATNYTKNPLAMFNEAWVEHFRTMNGQQVMQEFISTTQGRMETLHSMTEADLEMEVEGPIGMMAWREFLKLRTFDCHCHEQDIRRAVGMPGHMEGPVTANSVQRCLTAMPKVVAKNAKAPDGTVIGFDLLGPEGGQYAVGVQEGRGVLLKSLPAKLTAAMRLPVETFLILCWGRKTAAQVVAAGQLQIGGDTALAQKVLESINILF